MTSSMVALVLDIRWRPGTQLSARESSTLPILLAAIVALMILVDCGTSQAAAVDTSTIFITRLSHTCRQLTPGALTRRLRHDRVRDDDDEPLSDLDLVSARSRNKTAASLPAVQPDLAKKQRQNAIRKVDKRRPKRHRKHASVDDGRHNVNVTSVGLGLSELESQGHGKSQGEEGEASSPPWQCQWEPRWARLGQGHFPSYVLSGRCEIQRTCMFGLYECQPKKYAITVLRRVPGQCVPLPSTDSSETVYEELWVPTKHRVTVGCECARRTPSHSHHVTHRNH